MNAIDNAAAAVGILATNGIVLATQKAVTSKLLAPPKSSDKIFALDDHCLCAIAGLTSDANILLNYARLTAQRYYYTYQEPQPIEQLIESVCDTKQVRLDVSEVHVYVFNTIMCIVLHTVWRSASFWSVVLIRWMG